MEDTKLKGLYNTRSTFSVNGKEYHFYRVKALEEEGIGNVSRLPYSIKVLLEAAVREFDEMAITKEHVTKLANWTLERDTNQEIPFKPARILLHDTTGLPAMVDLAAIRETCTKWEGIFQKSIH